MANKKMSGGGNLIPGPLSSGSLSVVTIAEVYPWAIGPSGLGLVGFSGRGSYQVAFDGFFPTTLIDLLLGFKRRHRGFDVKIIRVATKTAFRFGPNRPVSARHPANVQASCAITEWIIVVDRPAFLVKVSGR
jgi:hypothetical protein